MPAEQSIPQPDIYICATLPHMDKPAGKMFNINLSAGIEVDRCHDYIMKGVNQWDLNILISKFSKGVYENSDIKPTSKLETLLWGIDTDIFKITDVPNKKVDEQMNKIKEDECFLFVGQSTSPHLFGDRKDMSSLIKTFCEAFRGKPNRPALILKTSGTNFSAMDRNATIERVQQVRGMVENNDVNVYVLHGELTDEEMNALYNHKKVIAHVSFTHSEGWGQPLLQASLSGKPVFASDWSGHLDFLSREKSILLPGKVETIPDHLSSEYFMKGSKWFSVDYEASKKILQDYFYGDRTEINNRAIQQSQLNSQRFNLNVMESNFHKILDKYIRGV
jgi:glycosyltransferase involved in cell wall biosynthesis